MKLSFDPVNTYLTRVRSHQTDLNGVVWHGAFFGIFDDARIETFRQFDYTYERVVSEGWQLVVRRVECDYFAPARMDDLLAVSLTVPRMTKATLTIAYDCRKGDVLLARASTTYVYIDATGKPLRVPIDLVRVIEEHAKLLNYSPRAR
jgi:acyl-CoA thioester hydrolase